MKEVVDKLISLNKTIATMESCTGGSVVNSITNIEGASDVIKFSAVTYSNDYKIKMGVSEDLISKYSVYSKEVAADMARAISCYTNANYGIGITGKLNRIDKNNLYGDDNTVFVSVYDKDNNKYYDFKIVADQQTRQANKDKITKYIIEKLKEIIV